MNRFLRSILFGLAVLVAGSCGTGAVTGCAAIAHVLPDIVTGVTDAIIVLNEIDAFVQHYFADHPNPVLAAKVEKALAKCRASLDIALRASKGSGELSQQQADAAFADFKTAYQDLMVLVGPLGVHEIGKTRSVGAGGEELAVPRPLALEREAH